MSFNEFLHQELALLTLVGTLRGQNLLETRVSKIEL